MNQLCRHLFAAGRPCTQPAVRPTLYCRHHQVIKLALKKVEPRPDPYGIWEPLPFVFPEDRAALQINFMLVVQALNDKRLDLRAANTFNRILRSCEMNLKHGPLSDPTGEDAVQRVILTPDGEEIAFPREVLEPGEAAPVHGKDCPCQRCAELFRNQPQEQHHPDCQCGWCSQPSVQRTALRDQAKTSDRSGADITAVPQPSHENTSDESVPATISAEPRELHGEPLAIPEKQDPNESPYKPVIREYWKWQDAKAAARGSPILPILLQPSRPRAASPKACGVIASTTRR